MEQLGPYVVEREVGRGGAGVVLRCRAPDGRAVAVKLLLDPRKNSLLSRFARERALLHELAEEGGFVPLLDAGESPRGPYLVMPFVEGGTLRARLAGERLTTEQTLELLGDLAAAIGRAHARGIVHRDLKPENVLFTRDGAPLIADLGLAKHFTDSSLGAGASLSRTGEMRGTPGYMAPEQIRSAKEVGPPADVFALGAMLHECLTRRPAFTGEGAMQIMACVLDGVRESVRSLAPDVPQWVSDLVDRALAPDQADRFRDGAELAAAIERGLRGEGGRRRRYAWVAALGAALCVALAVLAVLTRRAEPPAPSPVALPTPPPATSLAPSTEATVAAVPSLVVTGRLGSTWFRHARTPTAVAIGPGATPGSEVAYVGNSDGFLYLWRFPDGEELTSFAALSGEAVRSIHPVHGRDAGVLLVGSRRGLAYLRPDVSRLKNIGTHTGRIVAAATGWKKPLAASVDETGFVFIWDLSAGKGLMRIDCSHDPPTALAFFPDDETLLVAMSNGEIVPVRLEPTKILPRLFAAKPPIRALALSPEGDRVAVSMRDGGGVVVELGTMQPTSLGRVGSANVLVFGSAGKLFGAIDDGTVFASDVAKGVAEQLDVSGSRATPGLALSADGRVLFLAAPNGQPRLLGTKRDEGHEGVVTTLLALPGGRLASGGADQSVRIWDLATGREVACARDHADALVSLATEPDGSFVSASRDGGVASRETATARSRSQRVLPRIRLERVRVTSDGKAWGATPAGIVPAGAEEGLVTWTRRVLELAAVERDVLAWDEESTLARLDPRTGEVRWQRPLLRRSARCAIAVVSATRAAVSHEKGVQLLDLATGQDVWPAPLVIDSLGAGLASSPDGRFLALLQLDAVVLLSAATGEVLSRAVVTGRGDAPTSVAFAGDELLVGLARGPILRLRWSP